MASLIIAYSARALAQAAARAGEPVHVIDWFADEDTRAAAETYQIVPPGKTGSGFARIALDAALQKLAGRFDKIVYGAGIEGRPTLLARLERAGPVFGNRSPVLKRVKDPVALSDLLRRAGASHPEISFTRPDEPGWLAKRIGGSGGGHVTWAGNGSRRSGQYYQRAVAGNAVSVLFAADGGQAVVLGFSEQWTAPTSTSPFRYGGCAGPIDLDETTATTLADLCSDLTAEAGLVGLNGLDCLIAPDGKITVIEINPRPGAAIDVFDELNLWQIHIDAVSGRLPPRLRQPSSIKRAACILYADQTMTMPSGFAWPDWTADRTMAGQVIAKAAPICTVFAEADLVSHSRQLLENRTRSLYKRLIDGNAVPAAPSNVTSHTDPSVAV